MRASAVSFTHKLIAAALAALLAFTLVPFAYADGEGTGVEGSEGAFGSEVPTSPQSPSDPSTEAANSDVTLSEAAESREIKGPGEESPTLASGLVGKPSSFINSDVALDGELVIGSLTVDGLTFAVVDGPYVELVGVSSGWQQVTSLQEGEGFGVAPMLASGSDGVESDAATLALPETVSYESSTYTLTSIAPYAFYLSGVTNVTLPASVNDVDDRAFRSSDVSNVAVAEGNPTYSSFDGALYDADQLSLLLIPEGKQGTVRIPKTAEVVDSSVFSHCPLVESISVDAGSAAFASENGLLYTSDLTTLLRVPAGATEITIREGCTSIAAGALEACAKLTTINAPSTVTSISPDVFHAIPTVSLPVASAILGEGSEAVEVEGSNEGQASEVGGQITAMVALSSTDNDLQEVVSSLIMVTVSEEADSSAWVDLGFTVKPKTNPDEAPLADAEKAASANAGGYYTWGMCLYTSSNVNSILGYCPADRFHWPDGTGTFAFKADATLQWNPGATNWLMRFNNPGCTFVCYSSQDTYPGGTTWTTKTLSRLTYDVYAIWRIPVTWDANGGYWGEDPFDTQAKVDTLYTNDAATGWQGDTIPTRPGYKFIGWESAPISGVEQQLYSQGQNVLVRYAVTYIAQWEPITIDFDTSSEPGDEDYPGEDKESIVAPDEVQDDDTISIEDPKRPGYVFQGWTIPNAEGTEAIDQDLVYQGDDGKWYVDASKLPDYAGDDGRVELTARWTSVISVDVPSSVTFYADVVTQGNESREGLASSAFGQNKVASQSEVDLRIVGLESKQVKGNGSTSLGASDILKKKDGNTISSTADKLFSLYPTTGELKEDDLKDPDATSASKPVGAVDFSLDDILLEKSFAADKFTIPAGDTLSLGYRLNLQETSTELDYDKLSTLSEGTSASIANISYCFAADALPSDWGEPLWIENPDQSTNPAKYLLLDDIKAAAEDLSTHAGNPSSSEYYKLFSSLVGTGTFHLKVDGCYVDLQLLGICQDTKASGGKAGLSFQTKDIYAREDRKNDAVGAGAFLTAMHTTPDSSMGWSGAALRGRLCGTDAGGHEVAESFWGYLDAAMRKAIVPVKKRQQRVGGSTAAYLQDSNETIWLPSAYEVYGRALVGWNGAEAPAVAGQLSFQYQAYMGGSMTGGNAKASKTFNGSPHSWSLRSAREQEDVGVGRFCAVVPDGAYGSTSAINPIGVAPAFCL